MNLFILIIIGFSLSMDAFSLSLLYGTVIKKNNIKILSIIVGIYHFFMPLIGMFVGKNIVELLPIKPNTLVFIVLFLIGIEMIIESFKEEREIKSLNFLEMLLFGLAVSIDSFSLGLGLKIITNSPYIAFIIFSILSATFTFLGLKIGRYINKKIGYISTLIGGITLIFVGIMYIV